MYEIGREQGVLNALFDPEGMPVRDLYVDESDPLQFLDEVTLRQGTGYSTGPCRGMSDDLGGELGFV